jgi:hypothetical protein
MECREHLSQTRAALAQPEPEVVGLSDEELLDLADDCGLEKQEITTWDGESRTVDHGWECTDAQLVTFATELFTRYARPTIEPVPVAERPWEREGWCNSDNEAFFFDSDTKKWSLCECDKYSPVMTNASDRYTHSFPHNTLPVPGAEVG